jgi:hypothetical protein
MDCTASNGQTLRRPTRGEGEALDSSRGARQGSGSTGGKALPAPIGGGENVLSMERITLILISIALAFLSLPGAASAADTVPYPDVVGGPEIVCTPQKCKYELRCEPVDPFGCLYGDLTLGTRYQVFTKFNSEQLSSPYSGVIGSGRSVKLRTSPFGRKEIKRYLQRDKRKLSGGWDLSRLEAILSASRTRRHFWPEKLDGTCVTRPCVTSTTVLSLRTNPVTRWAKPPTSFRRWCFD